MKSHVRDLKQLKLGFENRQGEMKFGEVIEGRKTGEWGRGGEGEKILESVQGIAEEM